MLRRPVGAGVSPALFCSRHGCLYRLTLSVPVRTANSMLARLLIVALTFFPLAARACDLCGCYSPQVESMPNERVSLTGFYTAIAEQFTHFGSLQFDDREVANPTGQRLDSSVTQFVIGYEINDRLAVQFNAPVIYRDFRRPEGFAIDEGNVSGIGDVSLLAKAVLWHFASTAWREFNVEGKNPVAIEHEPDCTCSVVALAGLKFPTGDSSRLKEEFHEVEFRARRRTQSTATISPLAPARMMGFSACRVPCVTRIFLQRPMANSLSAATAHTIIILPMT